MIPTTLPLLAGVRMLLRVSVPRAVKDRPSARETPEPLDDPYKYVSPELSRV